MGVIWQLFLSFICKYKGPKITKSIVKKSKTGHLFMLLNNKTYYKAKLGKSAIRNRPMEQNREPREQIPKRMEMW